MRRHSSGRARTGLREPGAPSRSVSIQTETFSVCFQATGFADDVCHFGKVVFFLRWGEWDRAVQSGNADDGAVEIIEGFFVDDGGDFAGEASRAGVLVEDDDFVRLLYCLGDGFAVERRDGA